MYDNLTIKEFLGLILIFPIYFYVAFVLIGFIGKFRDFFKEDEDENEDENENEEDNEIFYRGNKKLKITHV